MKLEEEARIWRSRLWRRRGQRWETKVLAVYNERSRNVTKAKCAKRGKKKARRDRRHFDDDAGLKTRQVVQPATVRKYSYVSVIYANERRRLGKATRFVVCFRECFQLLNCPNEFLNGGGLFPSAVWRRRRRRQLHANTNRCSNDCIECVEQQRHLRLMASKA